MVRSWSHHLRYQWSQISTFVSLNHICHQTYFKSSYVHIQVFHILHHHTMKLLLAFKSFLPERPIVEIGSENWFAAGCVIRQWKLFRCWHHNSGSKCYSPTTNTISTTSHKFAANNTTSAANHNFVVEHTIRAESHIRCSQLSFDSESQIRCRQFSFDSESRIRCRTHNSAANANSLQTTQFW